MANGDVITTATAHPLSLRASLAHASYTCFFCADEKFLPVKEEPQGRQRGGDGQQGAALRRRAESQQHRRQDRGAREHDPELHDQVTRVRAGEAGEAQVLQQRPVLGPHGSDQAQLTSLPQELLPVQLRAECRWRLLHGCLITISFFLSFFRVWIVKVLQISDELTFTSPLLSPSSNGRTAVGHELFLCRRSGLRFRDLLAKAISNEVEVTPS